MSDQLTRIKSLPLYTQLNYSLLVLVGLQHDEKHVLILSREHQNIISAPVDSLHSVSPISQSCCSSGGGGCREKDRERCLLLSSFSDSMPSVASCRCMLLVHLPHASACYASRDAFLFTTVMCCLDHCLLIG